MESNIIASVIIIVLAPKENNSNCFWNETDRRRTFVLEEERQDIQSTNDL